MEQIDKNDLSKYDFSIEEINIGSSKNINSKDHQNRRENMEYKERRFKE